MHCTACVCTAVCTHCSIFQKNVTTKIAAKFYVVPNIIPPEKLRNRHGIYPCEEMFCILPLWTKRAPRHLRSHFKNRRSYISRQSRRNKFRRKCSDFCRLVPFSGGTSKSCIRASQFEEAHLYSELLQQLFRLCRIDDSVMETKLVRRAKCLAE